MNVISVLSNVPRKLAIKINISSYIEKHNEVINPSVNNHRVDS